MFLFLFLRSELKKCQSKVSQQQLLETFLQNHYFVHWYLHVCSQESHGQALKVLQFPGLCENIGYTPLVSLITHAFAVCFLAIYNVVVRGSSYSLPFFTEPADVCGCLVRNWLQL